MEQRIILTLDAVDYEEAKYALESILKEIKTRGKGKTDIHAVFSVGKQINVTDEEHQD